MLLVRARSPGLTHGTNAAVNGPARVRGRSAGTMITEPRWPSESFLGVVKDLEQLEPLLGYSDYNLLTFNKI
jgi:hypothetical protein